MKYKSTKYALISSIMATCLCVVMLICSTFAWFSSSVKANVKDIRSGTLTVDLVDSAGKSLAGKILKWVNADGGNDVTWEAGCTNELNTAYIKNNGNINIKYRVVINGLKSDEKLPDIIDFTAEIDGKEIDLDSFEDDLRPRARVALKIKAHIDEKAGKELQNLSVNGISITVQATQNSVEFDSDDNWYAEVTAAADKITATATDPEATETTTTAEATTVASATTEEATTVAPTIAETTTVAPTIAETTTIAPTIAQATTVAPTIEETTTVAPTTAQATTVAPTIAETTTVAPTIAEATTVVPTIEETITVAPTIEETTTVAPTTAETTIVVHTTAKTTTADPE
ncbi:MAG: hypothetical protein IJO14_03780 [Clostridia bacterium]|nr:hypothetical protein [Clostridia bacterium]